MSAHYSKVFLNTYSITPYFEAHMPEDYPLQSVLQKCRAFRRLPPRLRELSGLAKQWARRCYPLVAEMHEEWYDDQGYELYPDTDRRLTDEEIDEDWDHLDLGLDDFEVKDIPIPKGGFADPATWEEPAQEVEPDLVDRDGLTREQILSDVASRGFEATAREYGVPRTMLPAAGDADGLAQVILGMHGQEWPPDEAAS